MKKSSNITQCMKNKHTLKYLWYVMDVLHCGIENVDSVDMNERALLRYLKPKDSMPHPKGSLSFSIHP